jgi:hypothetical protein
MLFPRGINASRPRDPNTHQVPRIPLLIDGKETERGAIRQLNGRPLHTVIDQDALDGKALHVFSNRDEAEQYYRGHMIPGSPPPGTGYMDLYEAEYWGGCSWQVLERSNYPGDFRKLWACGFLWWWWRNPDKNVRCVDFWTGATTVILCSGYNLGGSWLWLPGTAWVESLAPYGWNNRASSMLWMYFG